VKSGFVFPILIAGSSVGLLEDPDCHNHPPFPIVFVGRLGMFLLHPEGIPRAQKSE